MGYTVYWEQLPFSTFTYNNVINLIPKVISSNTNFRIESWGFIIGNDDDNCSVIERKPTQMTFSKTNRHPYTKEFMKALIIMVEFGAAYNLNHDDNDMGLYLEALEEVNARHPLVSYEQQKNTFSKSMLV